MVYFLLPAYNEEANIGPLLDKIHALGSSLPPYEVLVVDDGSTDATAETVRGREATMPIRLISHDTNRGLPASLRDGIASVLELAASDEDIVVTMDADNTHEPSLVLEMLGRFGSGADIDVVIASRYQKGGQEVGLAYPRRVMSRVANVMLKVLFNIPGVLDYTSGYRAYRCGALRRAVMTYDSRLIESTTFSATAELLLKLRSLGVRAREVALVLRYDRKSGASKMRIARTVLDYFRMMFRVASLRHQEGSTKRESTGA